MRERTLEELESELARTHRELFTAKKNVALYYEQLRRLENRVRKTIVVGEHTDSENLYILVRSIPRKPRLTMNEIKKGRRKR